MPRARPEPAVRLGRALAAAAASPPLHDKFILPQHNHIVNGIVISLKYPKNSK